MITLKNNNLSRLRFFGFWEGLSLLILLFIAMPIKYVLGYPLLVRIVGTIHGVLFLLFVFLTFIVANERNWSFFRITIKVLFASIIPFGTFIIDHKILKKQSEADLG